MGWVAWECVACMRAARLPTGAQGALPATPARNTSASKAVRAILQCFGEDHTAIRHEMLRNSHERSAASLCLPAPAVEMIQAFGRSPWSKRGSQPESRCVSERWIATIKLNASPSLCIRNTNAMCQRPSCCLEHNGAAVRSGWIFSRANNQQAKRGNEPPASYLICYKVPYQPHKRGRPIRGKAAASKTALHFPEHRASVMARQV